MAPSKDSAQEPNREAGSILCDKCRNPVLEPDQKASNLPYVERLSQVAREWRLSPRMWPVGYLIESSYSPFRVEQELPERDWRNAFEDLIALESGGEMISLESRKEEQAAAAHISWKKASYLIGKFNQVNERESSTFVLLQRAHELAVENKNHTISAWAEGQKAKFQRGTQLRIAFAQEAKARGEARREWSASRHKERGQWIASLITSGALTNWASEVRDSADGAIVSLQHVDTSSKDNDSVAFTEFELEQLYEHDRPLEDGLPGPPMYYVASQDATEEEFAESTMDYTKPPPDTPPPMSWIPDRPFFRAQRTTAKPVTLPNGKTGTRVTLTNELTNGEIEQKVIIQEPVKVLEEVERVRALIQDRSFGFY